MRFKRKIHMKRIQFSGDILTFKDFTSLIKILVSKAAPGSLYKFLLIVSLFNLLLGLALGVLI